MCDPFRNKDSINHLYIFLLALFLPYDYYTHKHGLTGILLNQGTPNYFGKGPDGKYFVDLDKFLKKLSTVNGKQLEYIQNMSQ